MKFDGKGFARVIEARVRNAVINLGRMPHVVSILVGDDPASHLYTKLKKQAAERVGIEFEVVEVDPKNDVGEIVEKVGKRDDIDGVMVQLPIPGLSKAQSDEILEKIPANKDIDGLMYPKSGVVPPVVMAILQVIDEIKKEYKKVPKTYVVVGASGFVGSATCLELSKRGIEVVKIDASTQDAKAKMLQGDLIISCVGKEGVVSEEMVTEGAVVIDVGAPSGDMTKEVYQKASVSVEVPGGIGPVTIACLLYNAMELYDRITPS